MHLLIYYSLSYLIHVKYEDNSRNNCEINKPISIYLRTIEAISNLTYPIALCTALSKLLLIALNAYDVLISRHKAVTGDRLATNLATEAVFMPLLTHVFILFHS